MSADESGLPRIRRIPLPVALPPAERPVDLFPRVEHIQLVDPITGDVIEHHGVRVKLFFSDHGRTLKVLLVTRGPL